MKIKHIILCGLSMTALTACNDYLDVEAPSKVTDEYVFSNTAEADRLLNAVYESTCSGNTYGNAYLTTFNFNSDVEFATSSAEIQSASHNEWKLFDGEADGSNVKSLWDAAYETIERANNFVCAAEQSELYKQGNADLLQMVGEAKCIRAMNFLDLVILFGDVPFTFTRTYEQENLVMPMGQRDEILTALINDLKAAAPKMRLAKEITEGVERCSKEYAWALISRIALFRGGYSLRPGSSETEVGTMQRPSDYMDYYHIARTYADSVINESGHSLTNDYFQVFIDECNYKVNSADDVIFEIPFTMNVNGNIGYIHGPKCDLSSAGDTDHAWGRTSGSVGLNSFYRYTFDPQDARRDMVGYWSYNFDGTPVIQNTYTNYCLKWSKFWDQSASMGNTSQGSTGINFPYMRYADVLLMFAEAENEINGPTDAAKAALKQVRERAFRNAANKAEKVDGYVDALGSKDAFFQAIVDERAWEFGG
ncbi:MAG: RagB/SusD family nutrient uptake outer membrane protein, partial [Prevotella sp.]|nr:RagB/SusD family nutrient uptake outer membrane protein [Prevotella sp.]